METLRLVNAGAEKYMAQGPIKVLDKGYISVVDYMGVDETVVAAARQSYDKGMKQDDTVGNERLINFLMRHNHTSPFEQPAIVFEVKAPIMVFREWHRHRLAKLNEMSGRYTELPEEYYIPEISRIGAQSTTNKQGTGEALDPNIAEQFQSKLDTACKAAFNAYHRALEMGIAKELARLSLPVNTYSKMIWQADLRNTLAFIKLRADEKAQWEIRQYANVMCDVVAASFPKVWAAFEEFNRKAVTFSQSEMLELRNTIDLESQVSPTLYQKLRG